MNKEASSSICTAEKVTNFSSEKSATERLYLDILTNQSKFLWSTILLRWPNWYELSQFHSWIKGITWFSSGVWPFEIGVKIDKVHATGQYGFKTNYTWWVMTKKAR